MHEPKQDKNANTKTDRQQTAVKNVSRQGQGITASPLDPLVQQVSRMGNAPNPSAHAAILNRAPANQQSSNRQLLLQLQQQYGNPYVNQVLQLARGMGEETPANTTEQPLVQTKLKIGSVGDKYEQEADRTAQQVVQRMNAPSQSDGGQAIGETMPEAELQKKPEISTIQRQEMPEEKEKEQQAEVKQETDSLQLQKKCGGCEKKEEGNLAQMKPETGTFPQEEIPKDEEKELTMQPLVQRQPAGGGKAVTTELEASIQQAQGKGEPLADNIRQPMEQEFGADFSSVRIHADAKADEMNQSLQARAFTVGQDIFFRQGAYDPNSKQGQELLAHELTHVIQQNGSEVEPTSDQEMMITKSPEDTGVQRASSQCPPAPDDSDGEEKDKNKEECVEKPSGCSTGNISSTPEEGADDEAESQSSSNTPEPQPLQKAVSKDNGSQLHPQGRGKVVSSKTKPQKIKATTLAPEAPATDLDLETQAEAANRGILAQKAEATEQALKAQVQLYATNAETARLTSTGITFALPQQKTTVPGEDNAVLQQQQMAIATTMASSFLAQGALQVQKVTALGQEILEQIQEASKSSIASVMGTIEQQKASVATQMTGQRDQAQSDAQATIAHIHTRYKVAKAAVPQKTTVVRQHIETEYAKALFTIDEREGKQLDEINESYIELCDQFQNVGQTIGDEAFALGEQRAKEWESQKINRPDNISDGYLTDKRLDARADAARKVAKQYKCELINEANAQADEIQKQKPKDIKTAHTIAEQYRQQAQILQQNSLENLSVVEEETLSQVVEAQIQLTESAKETLKSTLQSLNEQEAVQVQLLEGYGQRQILAIERDAQNAIASLQNAVNQIATSLQKALENSIAQFQGIEAPKPEELSVTLAEILRRFDSAIALVRGQTQKGIATSIKGITQAGKQAIGAVTGIAESGIDESATVVEETKTTLARLKKGATHTFNEIRRAYTKRFTETTQTVVKGFSQIIEKIESTFKQNFDQSRFKKSVNDLEEGLRESIHGYTEQSEECAIKYAADKAADQVQPRWKEVLKWFVIIFVAIVTVVLTIFVAPAGILLAIAFGVLVGVVSSIISTIIINAIYDKKWSDDLGYAALAGAIGGVLGGIGGAVGQAVNIGVKAGKEVLKKSLEFAARFGIDQVFNALGSLFGDLAVTGMKDEPIDWKAIGENIGTGAALGAGAYGLGSGLNRKLAGIAKRAKVAEFAKKHQSEIGKLDNLDPKNKEAFDEGVNKVAQQTGVDPKFIAQLAKLKPDQLKERVEKAKELTEKLDKSGFVSRFIKQRAITIADRHQQPQREENATGEKAPETTILSETSDRDTSTVSHPDTDVTGVKRPETEEKAPETTILSETSDRDTSPVSRPDTDVTGVKRPETEEKAPETTTSSGRSTHFDEPEIEPGVVAKENTADGHEIKVLRDGRIVRCTTCADIREKYKNELAQNPELTKRLNEIEKEPDENQKAQRANQLARELEGTGFVITQPGYATGDMFGIVATLIMEPKSHVVISKSPGVGKEKHDPRYKADSIRQFYIESGIPPERIHILDIKAEDMQKPGAKLKEKANNIAKELIVNELIAKNIKAENIKDLIAENDVLQALNALVAKGISVDDLKALNDLANKLITENSEAIQTNKEVPETKQTNKEVPETKISESLRDPGNKLKDKNITAEDVKALIAIKSISATQLNTQKYVRPVDAGTEYVEKNFTPQMQKEMRKAWGVNDSKDVEIKTWLESKGVTIEGDNVLVLWSRFSGKKGEIHLEHDSSHEGIKQTAEMAAKLGYTVIIAGDKGYKPEESGKYDGIAEGINTTFGSKKVFNLTQFWTDKNVNAWGGNTRLGQLKLYDYLHRKFDTKHLGFRSGNLEAMTLLGHKVRYMEEPDSEGSQRMKVWKEIGYRRLKVKQPPTRSGKYLKSLKSQLQTTEEKNQLEKNKSQLKEANKNLKSQNKKLDQKEFSLEGSKEDTKVPEKRKEKLQNEIVELQKDIEKSNTEIQKLETEIQKLETEIQQLEQNIRRPPWAPALRKSEEEKPPEIKEKTGGQVRYKKGFVPEDLNKIQEFLMNSSVRMTLEQVKERFPMEADKIISRETKSEETKSVKYHDKEGKPWIYIRKTKKGEYVLSPSPDVETPNGRGHETVVTGEKAPETTRLSETSDRDTSTISRPDADVTSVKRPETEEKAPETTRLSETSDRAQLTNNYELTPAQFTSLENNNLALIEIKPDGDCFYSAVIRTADENNIELPDGVNNIMSLRQHAANYVINNPKSLADTLAAYNVAENQNLTFEQIALKIETIGSYNNLGGELAPGIIANALKVNLNIHNGDGSTTPVAPAESSNGTINLVRVTQPHDHYHATGPKTTSSELIKPSSDRNTSTVSRSDADVTGVKRPETEEKAPDTTRLSETSDRNTSTVSRPDADVTSVKRPETEEKAPETTRLSETSDRDTSTVSRPDANDTSKNSDLEQTLTQALPPKLQGKVPVNVDPDRADNSVRVHYDVDPKTGLVTNIRMRVGQNATAVDIKLHVKTVQLMQRYSGLLGRIHILKQRLQSWISKNGKPPVGSRAWEAKLEIEKLPRIINERLERLSKGDLDTDTEANLRADIKSLEQQLAQHQQTLDEMDANPGVGFVAMNKSSTQKYVPPHLRMVGQQKSGQDSSNLGRGKQPNYSDQDSIPKSQSSGHQSELTLNLEQNVSQEDKPIRPLTNPRNLPDNHIKVAAPTEAQNLNERLKATTNYAENLKLLQEYKGTFYILAKSASGQGDTSFAVKTKNLLEELKLELNSEFNVKMVHATESTHKGGDSFKNEDFIHPDRLPEKLQKNDFLIEGPLSDPILPKQKTDNKGNDILIKTHLEELKAKEKNSKTEDINKVFENVFNLRLYEYGTISYRAGKLAQNTDFDPHNVANFTGEERHGFMGMGAGEMGAFYVSKNVSGKSLIQHLEELKTEHKASEELKSILDKHPNTDIAIGYSNSSKVAFDWAKSLLNAYKLSDNKGDNPHRIIVAVYGQIFHSPKDFGVPIADTKVIHAVKQPQQSNQADSKSSEKFTIILTNNIPRELMGSLQQQNGPITLATGNFSLSEAISNGQLAIYETLNFNHSVQESYEWQVKQATEKLRQENTFGKEILDAINLLVKQSPSADTSRNLGEQDIINALKLVLQNPNVVAEVMQKVRDNTDITKLLVARLAEQLKKKPSNQ